MCQQGEWEDDLCSICMRERETTNHIFTFQHIRFCEQCIKSVSSALGQYTTINNSGKWNAKTPEEEQVVAISARFEKLKDANLKLSKAIKEKSISRQKGSKPSGKSSQSESKNIKKNNLDKFAWKQVNPEAGQSHKKTVDGKEYQWCPWHKAWTVHDPNDERPEHRCRLKPVAN